MMRRRDGNGVLQAAQEMKVSTHQYSQFSTFNANYEIK